MRPLRDLSGFSATLLLGSVTSTSSEGTRTVMSSPAERTTHWTRPLSRLSGWRFSCSNSKQQQVMASWNPVTPTHVTGSASSANPLVHAENVADGLDEHTLDIFMTKLGNTIASRVEEVVARKQLSELGALEFARDARVFVQELSRVLSHKLGLSMARLYDVTSMLALDTS